MTRPDPCSAQPMSTPIYQSVRDPRARQRLVSSFDLETTEPDWTIGLLRYPRRQHGVAIAHRVIEKAWMIDAMLSRVRLRDLGGPRRPSASRRRTGTDGAAIAAGTSPRPSTPSSRPGTDDFMASII